MVDIPVYESTAETLVTATSAGQEIFSFDFLVFTEDQTKVEYRPATGTARELVLNTDYTVSGLNLPNGGSINLAGITVAVGDQLYIWRETPIEREKDWQNEGDYKADLVNREQDEIYMIMQELKRAIGKDGEGIIELTDALASEVAARISGDQSLSDRIDQLVAPSKWLVGSGAPSDGIGIVGDMYLDVDSGDVYGPKSSTAWGSASANIEGAPGAVGPRGENSNVFNSLAAAAAAVIGSEYQYVMTAGHSIVGKGSAFYRRVSSEPSHAGKFQSADGAWWEYAQAHVDVMAFGALGDGVADDTAAINNAFQYAILKAPLYKGAPRVHFPQGTYLVDTIRYNPTEYIPIKIHGDGKATTVIRRRLAGQTGNVFEIGNDPSTTYRGEISVEDMTIDGYDGTGNGLALFEVWYSSLKNIRLSNCDIGVVGAAAIYIDIYSPDFTWCRRGMDINNFPDASFPGTNPAVINIYGGVIWRNSECGIYADHFNSINTYGTGFEKNGTNKTASEGAIVTGDNVDRNGLSTGVTMYGGWVEDNEGLSQLRFGSGFNSVNNVRFWQPDGISSYSMHFITGKFSVNGCTVTAGSTSIIRHESGVGAGNRISLCNGFTYQVERQKTAIDEGASQSVMYQTVGGPGTTGSSLVVQDSTTYFQFTIEGGRLKLKQGNTDVDSWGL